jgi:ketosteroid isomerase-like protein
MTNRMTEFDRTTPEGAARYFQNCVRSGDLAGATSCFDAEAVYIPAIGSIARGTAEIRAGLEVVCNMKPDLQARRSVAYVVGGLASWVDEWHLQATLPDGTVLNLSGVSSDILTRRPDGIWVYLVDNPYGAAALNSAEINAGTHAPEKR